jgi:hypothetical protein
MASQKKIDLDLKKKVWDWHSHPKVCMESQLFFDFYLITYKKTKRPAPLSCHCVGTETLASFQKATTVETAERVTSG